ncbi:MAG: hypothetical protein ACR2J8_06625 [Thermomicrobiales bacterium]
MEATGPRLFFMHIPKTAGSSLRRMLEAAPATAGRCCWLKTGDPAADAPRLPCLETALVTGGHVRWDDAAVLPGGWQMITVLRDPLDRLLSLYSFQKMQIALGARTEASPVLRRELETRSFEDLAHDPAARFFRFTLPTQTLYLGGAPRGFIPARGTEVDAAAIAPVLDLAMERLEKTAWLGVTESLDRDLETLAATFGWETLGPSRRTNQTTMEHRLRVTDLEPETAAALRARLSPDYALLARAREIAAARHAAAV